MNLVQTIFASVVIAGLLPAFAPAVRAQSGPSDRASEVNPFIGTANGGNVFPGATMPFGMVQFSPEASPINPKRMIAAPGGYEDRATKIRGFSMTNVEGWGCAGGAGDVPIMPTSSAIDSSPSADFRNAYAAGFSHEHETAVPGSYQVRLSDGIEMRVAAGLRFGIASMQFPDHQPARVLVRSSDSEDGSTAASTQIDLASNTISGSVTSGNFCGYIDKEDRRSYYTLYFVAKFDRPFTEHGAWKDQKVLPNAVSAEGGTGFGPKGFPEAGHGSGVWVGFGQGGAVRMRVGISYVSQANALANLDAESSADTTYEQVAAKARMAWNRRLGQINVEGGTPEQHIVFNTALYHALQTPTTYSDSNGQYRGMDGQVHTLAAKQTTQYANFSGWDVYRSQMQLVTWLDPEVGSDIAQSLLNQSVQDGGRWDRWTHLSGATHVMNGDPAAPAIADIWALGGRRFDAHAALTSLVHAAEVPTAADLSQAGCPVECAGQRPALDQYLKLHYIPVGAPAWGAAADTLEDVTADFGVSALAGHLGEKKIESRFLQRAQYWKNIWNPNAAPDGGYFMDRHADGSWAMVDEDTDNDSDHKPQPFTPASEAGFVEGTAAQYVWMVPFNVAGLFAQMGGREKALARLNRFFYNEQGEPAVTNAGPLHAELNNEPSIETPWLYDFAGQPWKTQQLVRQVLNTLWVNSPKGIPGNDDLGEMSSWAVFAFMGLYPEIPGRAEMLLGSPTFSRISIHRPGGDLEISAQGASSSAFYVSGLQVDGRASTKTWLPENFVLHGGRLKFNLTSTPDHIWGSGQQDAPPSFAP
ncbi:MAG: GH92 family glycosyl hydrolase [Janthinobacterium lividum]